MSITPRTPVTVSSNPGTEIVLTLSGASKPITGDSIFVTVNWYEDNGAGASASLGSSNGFTYELIGEKKHDTNGFAALYAAYNIPSTPTTSEVITITKADSGNVYGNAGAVAVAGLASSPLDQSKVSPSTAGGSTSHTLTCDGANARAEEIAVAICNALTGNNPGIDGPPAGWTEIFTFVNGSVGAPGAAAFKVLSAVETTEVTFTGLTSADPRGGVLATFKGSSAGSKSLPPYRRMNYGALLQL